jgi:transposase
LSTKIHALVDDCGLPLRLALTPGQAHDVTAARQLLDQAVAGNVVLGDRSYDADWIVDLVQSQGGRANIPMYANRKRNRRDFDANLYKRRNLIERFFNSLKRFRRIATRYEKTARNFLAMAYIAAARLWAKFESTP